MDRLLIGAHRPLGFVAFGGFDARQMLAPRGIAARIDSSVHALQQLPQDNPGVADDADVGWAVVADFGRIDVNLDQACRGVEARRSQMADDVVDPRADDQQQVRLTKRRCARGREGQPVIVGHDAASLRGRVERQPGQLHQLLELSLGARPQDAAACDHQRPLGLVQQANRVVDQRRVGARSDAGQALVGAGVHDLVLFDLLVEQVARHVEVDGAGSATERMAHGCADELGHALGIGALLGPLGDRLERRHLVHLLESTLAALAQRRRTTDGQQRCAVGPGVGDAGHQVGGARAGGGHAHAERVLDPPEGVGHHRRGLLVAHVDAAQSFLHRGRLGGHHRPAHDVEERVDAQPT